MNTEQSDSDKARLIQLANRQAKLRKEAEARTVNTAVHEAMRPRS